MIDHRKVDMDTTTTKVAVGYVRVSTQEQADEGESLTTQRREIEEYCRIYGLDLLKIFSDEGISGKVKDRPGLVELLMRANQKEFGTVIVSRYSRFGRSAKDLLLNLDTLTEQNIRFISLKESIDTSTAIGRFFRTILAGFIEYEHSIIVEQMSENKMARWKEGRTFLGRAPFGYRWNREKKVIEVNQREAEIYNNIVNWYLDEGLSFLNIALRLKEKGIRCSRSYFKPSTVQYILRNPIYTGIYYANRHQYKDGKRTGELKPASEHIAVRVPPHISKTRWDAVQAKVAHNTVKSKRTTAAKSYWLRDIVQCGECGGSIKPHHGQVRRDGSFPRSYICYWRGATKTELITHDRKRCELRFIKADELEDYIWTEIVSRISFGGFQIKGKYRPSNIETIIDTSRYDVQISEHETQLAYLDADLKRLTTIRTRLFGLLEKSDYNQDEFTQKLRETDEAIQRLKSKQSEVRESLYSLTDLKSNLQGLSEFVTKNREWLHQIQRELYRLSPDDKKRLVESLIPSKIIIYSSSESESGWGSGPVKISFNTNIFDRLAEEGKISKFNSNGFNPSTGP